MTTAKKTRQIDTSEKQNRCGQDQLLRENGFRIHSRKRGREAEWELDGEVVEESEALRRCQEE